MGVCMYLYARMYTYVHVHILSALEIVVYGLYVYVHTYVCTYVHTVRMYVYYYVHVLMYVHNYVLG